MISFESDHFLFSSLTQKDGAEEQQRHSMWNSVSTQPEHSANLTLHLHVLGNFVDVVLRASISEDH